MAIYDERVLIQDTGIFHSEYVCINFKNFKSSCPLFITGLSHTDSRMMYLHIVCTGHTLCNKGWRTFSFLLIASNFSSITYEKHMKHECCHKKTFVRVVIIGVCQSEVKS
jgi:hypothetical protein